MADNALPVIGICGPSCSGKSTVAAILAASLGASLLRLDDYWIKGSVKPVVNGEPSYERPHQYDGDALAADVTDASERAPVVCEGFLLFSYPKLLAKLDHRYFLVLGHAEMKIRRRARAESLAAPGAGIRRIETSWLANGPEEWMSFGAWQAQTEGSVSIDADGQPSDIAAAMISRLPPGVTGGRFGGCRDPYPSSDSRSRSIPVR